MKKTPKLHHFQPEHTEPTLDELDKEILEQEEQMNKLEGLPSLTIEEVLERKVIKLDLGGGSKPAQGFINVDIQFFDGVDLILDAAKLDEHFPARSVDKIVCRDTLQCFKFTEIKGILKRWYKVLKPHSQMVLQCYDIKQLVEAYLNGKCECWKAGTRSANPDCEKCGGNATLNDARFRAMLFGSLQDEHRTHHNCFDEQYLTKLLTDIGFTVEQVEFPAMRLKIVARKGKK